MKKLTLTTLASACALVLTACGGGGGGGSSTPTPTVQTVAVPTVSVPTTTTTTTGTTTSTGTTGTTASTATTSTGTTASTAATSSTGTTSSAATSSSTKPSNTSTSNSTTETTKPTTSTPEKTTTVTASSVADAFAKTGFNKMKTYATYNDKAEKTDTTYTEYTKLYDGIHIKIDNKTGKVTAQETVQADFQDFTFDGVHMVFLARRDDVDQDTPTRQIVEKDFPSGGYNPKYPDNPGYMGSYWSPINTDRDQAAFGRLRFGVYTDGDNISHLFVHGTPATRAFKGTYKGSAIMGKNGDYKAYDRALTAVVNSDVDKIDITLKTDKTTLEFGGAVNANLLTFGGTKNGISTRGGFFGSDLGGVFEVTQGVHAGENGVFGASNIDDKEFAASFTTK